MFRTRPFTASGERITHGLLCTPVASGSAGDGTTRGTSFACPAGIAIVPFCELCVFVALVLNEYPNEVLTFSDKLLSPDCGALDDIYYLCVCVEHLRTPITPTANPAATSAELEEIRKKLFVKIFWTSDTELNLWALKIPKDLNPLLGCLGPPFIAQGVSTVAIDMIK
ncbi:DNA mismatch repair protein Mlh1 [Hordeum vulgare]|nr:DNA mismatch repair protein Mlh1 [Hordeum vulgare]